MIKRQGRKGGWEAAARQDHWKGRKRTTLNGGQLECDGVSGLSHKMDSLSVRGLLGRRGIPPMGKKKSHEFLVGGGRNPANLSVAPCKHKKKGDGKKKGRKYIRGRRL